MNQEYVKSAKEILDQVLYLTIATMSEESQPWNTVVAGAHDEKYNFYWGSHVDSQHSKNIRANSKIFLVIYDSTVEAGTGRGVYVQASARQLESIKEIKTARDVLQARYPKPFWPLEVLHDNGPIRLYKAEAKRFWHNSSDRINGHHVDKRVEIKL